MTLFGAGLPEASRHIGSLAQLARIDSFIDDNGPARGARRLRIISGGGLEIEVYPDRCLDIGQVTFRGVPVAWIAPGGLARPSARRPHGRDFLASFGGGLLATCGLDTFGPPSSDGGDELPMHGSVGSLAADVTMARATGESILVAGSVRQSRLFGENLLLERQIESPIGSGSFVVSDTVTNEGDRAAPHMILYHANFGWPLLSEHSAVAVNSVRRHGIDARAERELELWGEVDAAHAGYEERVYRHEFEREASGIASITNPELGMRATLTFPTDVLPAMFQWKMLGERSYALGLEPANCTSMAGRAAARAAGVLPMLEPGESVSYRLEFSFEAI